MLGVPAPAGTRHDQRFDTEHGDGVEDAASASVAFALEVDRTLSWEQEPAHRGAGSVDIADRDCRDAEHVAGSGRFVGDQVQHESR
jgi:hypothetical protein